MRLVRFTFAAGLALFAVSAAHAASPPELIAKGEYLARAGNCVSCHSTPDGEPFAGGLKMAVPFLGAIYTTNITPDKEHGIGDYTFEDFEGAMRRGVAKDGHMLYPAMPYPSYAKTSDEDLRALYAFFMEAVPAANVANKPSEIKSPLNIRWPLKIWNALFLPDAGYTPDSSKDAKWNRGAYLVEGLGHCGACHSPRGLFFQEKGYAAGDGGFLSGAELDNWHASNLRGDPLAGLGRWSESDTAEFLKTGHNAFSSAFGTMIEVINNSTQHMTDDDVAAMAVYLKSLTPVGSANVSYTYDQKTTDALRSGNFETSGERLYVQHCAACHGHDGRGHAPYLPPIAGNPTILDANPISLINVTLNGSARIVVQGMPDAYRMPQFRVLLNDQEIAEIISFMRKGWGHSAGGVTPAQVQKLRDSTNPASDEVVILRMR
ncbi:MAG: cytochrome c [Proteobacteria bacterium]|nr:cytochrome c [Pseudomonadota bacterium]